MKPLLNKHELKQISEDLGVVERFYKSQNPPGGVIGGIRKELDPLVLIAMDSKFGSWYPQLIDYAQRCIRPRLLSRETRANGFRMGAHWDRYHDGQQYIHIAQKVAKRILRSAASRPIPLLDRLRLAKEQILLNVFHKVAPGIPLSVQCEFTGIPALQSGCNRPILATGSWLDMVRRLGGPVAYYKERILLIAGDIPKEGDPRGGVVFLYEHRPRSVFLRRLERKTDRLYEKNGGKVGWIIRRSGWTKLARDFRGARERFSGSLYTEDLRYRVDSVKGSLVGSSNNQVDLDETPTLAVSLGRINFGRRLASHLFSTGEVGQFFH